jgi:hypothetical protein
MSREVGWELESDDEWEQLKVRCPTPRRETLGGFPRYSNSPASLPWSEQSKLKSIANLIVRSFQPGCQPILTVGLVGHADKDLQRERREPGYMLRISRERALAVRQALGRLINNQAIWSRIAWSVRGVGASRPVVPMPVTEPQRARNRRVDVSLEHRPCASECERGYRSCLERAPSGEARTRCKLRRLSCLYRCKGMPA